MAIDLGAGVLREVADEGEGGVVGGVVGGEEGVDVGPGDRRDRGVGADDGVVVGVLGREEGGEEAFDAGAAGVGLAALTAFLGDDRPHAIEGERAGGAAQKAHAIALQPQDGGEGVAGGEGVVLAGVEVGLAVVVVDEGAGAGGLAGVAVDVLRALEHEVLDDVGEAAALRRVVDGADVVAQVDGDQGEARVAAEDDLEAVGEAVVGVDGVAGGGRRGGGREGQPGGQEGGEQGHLWTMGRRRRGGQAGV